MARLTQLLATHDSILVLDAVSLRLQIGLLRSGQPPLWCESGEDAGRGLFIGVQSVLANANIDIDEVGAFVFCEGPGSMLGTRTVAMALRTWLTLKLRPVFVYQSLTLAGLAEWRREPRTFAIIADARRESWHRQQIGPDGKWGSLERRPTADMPAGELVTPAGFRVWSKPPGGLVECRYDIAMLLAETGEADLFRPVEIPDALQHAAPDYKKWTAQPHSAQSVVRP